MLRIIETFGNLPDCIEVDPDAVFQPGQIAGLRIRKGRALVGITDGLHPSGILDDIKSDRFRVVAKPKESTYVVPITHLEFDLIKNEVVLTEEHNVELKHTNIIAASFASSVAVRLDFSKGIATLPIGTACNYRLHPSVNGNGINDAVRFTVSYAYNVQNSITDDSTMGSGRATVWTKNMIADTDMYDTCREYRKYAPLFATHGLLTTYRTTPQCKCIGVVLAPPNLETGMLRFLLDLDGKIDVMSNAL